MTTVNETKHYEDAEKWLAKAEARYAECTQDMGWENLDADYVDRCLRFAAVHAQLSVAADHDRLTDCIPDGGSALAVSVRGR